MVGWLDGRLIFLSLSPFVFMCLYFFGPVVVPYTTAISLYFGTHTYTNTRINSGNRNGGFELACLEQSNKTVIIIVHKGETTHIMWKLIDRPTDRTESFCLFFFRIHYSFSYPLTTLVSQLYQTHPSSTVVISHPPYKEYT